MTAGSLVSVVFPAHNEAGNLAAVVDATLSALQGERVEIVIVDDGSTDDTWRATVDLTVDQPHVRGLRLTRNFGQQAAILAGLAAARGDAVVTLDADGQHPPELIHDFLQAWRNGAEIVQGVRTESTDAGGFKRLSSRCFYRIVSSLAGVQIQPGSSDFRLLDRRAVDLITRHSGPIPFLRGLLPWLGLPSVTVRYRARSRLTGTTSYSLARMVRLSLDGILSFSTVPLRLAAVVGATVSLLAFAYLIYVAFIRLTSGEVVPGWASTAGLLSLLGGFQLLTLGILGEYLGRLFLGSLGRPLFVVAEELDPESLESS